MAGFDFEASMVDRNLIGKLASLAFIEDAQNVVLIGGPGTGKTHLATALGIPLRFLKMNIKTLRKSSLSVCETRLYSTLISEFPT
jgi:DNA replication protein DnaC